MLTDDLWFQRQYGDVQIAKNTANEVIDFLSLESEVNHFLWVTACSLGPVLRTSRCSKHINGSHSAAPMSTWEHLFSHFDVRLNVCVFWEKCRSDTWFIEHCYQLFINKDLKTKRAKWFIAVICDKFFDSGQTKIQKNNLFDYMQTHLWLFVFNLRLYKPLLVLFLYKGLILSPALVGFMPS